MAEPRSDRRGNARHRIVRQKGDAVCLVGCPGHHPLGGTPEKHHDHSCCLLRAAGQGGCKTQEAARPSVVSSRQCKATRRKCNSRQALGARVGSHPPPTVLSRPGTNRLPPVPVTLTSPGWEIVRDRRRPENSLGRILRPTPSKFLRARDPVSPRALAPGHQQQW